MAVEVEYEWECRTKGGKSCRRKHKSEIKANGCCANNDALIERELREIPDHTKRRVYAEEHTRTPVKLRKKTW